MSSAPSAYRGPSGIFDQRPTRPGPQAASPISWPSADIIPGIVAAELLLGRTALAAVAAGRLRAYPTGVAFTLLVRLVGAPRRHHEPLPNGRGYRVDNTGFPHSLRWGHERVNGGVGGLPDDLLRIGVVFADGRTVTNLDADGIGSGAQAGVPNAQLAFQGGGGLRRWDFEAWLEPLPPPGPLGLVCEWPAKGIPMSRVDIDGSLVLAAAARAIGAPTFVSWPR